MRCKWSQYLVHLSSCRTHLAKYTHITSCLKVVLCLGVNRQCLWMRDRYVHVAGQVLPLVTSNLIWKECQLKQFGTWSWSWIGPEKVLISKSWFPGPEFQVLNWGPHCKRPVWTVIFFGDGQNLFLSLFLWMGGNFCEWGATFVNEGQILWMRVAGICAVCQSVGRCVCWQAGIPPRTKHCTCTWQCIFARWRGASLHLAVHLCTVGKSTAVANSRVHSYRFVHSLAWETLLTFSETRLVFQTLSASHSSSFQKLFSGNVLRNEFMQSISGIQGMFIHIYWSYLSVDPKLKHCKLVSLVGLKFDDR